MIEYEYYASISAWIIIEWTVFAESEYSAEQLIKEEMLDNCWFYVTLEIKK
jgi:hypothetical protein